jgi:hypothetical protein
MLSPFPIRLFCDLAAPATVLDLNRSQPPSFYRGDDIEIDIGIGQSGALMTSLASSGAGGVASVTCQLFASENDTNAPMMSCTVPAAAMNLTLTSTQWTTAPYTSANSHAQFLFPGAQTGVALNGAASVNYWLRITALTTDTPAKTITLLDGPITVRDGPVSVLTAPAGAQFRLLTIGTQIVPQLLDTTTGLYHTLAILNDGGVLTLQLSDQGY